MQNLKLKSQNENSKLKINKFLIYLKIILNFKLSF
jgi:hypothetical protein